LDNFNNFLHATLTRNLMHRSVVLATSPQRCRYTTMWNAKFAVRPLTTMNSYQVAYASAQKLLTQ